MISPRPVDGAVVPQRSTNLRSGDKITVTAVRHLEKSIWQVSLKGKLLPVTSAIRLTAGKRYTGRVFWKGSTLIFRHEGKQETAQDPRKPGLDPREQKLFAILRQLHMPVRDEIIGSILKKAGAAKDDAKILRLIAALYDKNIDVDPRDTRIDPLYVFKRGGGGEDPNRNGRHKNGRNRKGNAEAVRREYSETAETLKNRFREGLRQSLRKKGESRLQLFNHVLSEHDHWIIIPVGFTVDGTVIEGSLRLKMDTHAQTVTAMAVLIEADGRRYGFSIPGYDTGAPVCRLFGSKTGKTDIFLEIFSEKLSKLGIKLDDTINNDDSFDGFEKNENTGFKTVDTVI
jgi:hypothetical protein